MNSETKHERLGKDDELKVATSATLMTTPDHLKPAYQKPFRPAACHPSRPIYGAGPWCRRCKDLLRWQGERGRAKVLADVETNYAGSEELKAEFVSEAKRKLDAIREYAPRRKKSEDADSRSIRTSHPKV